MKADETRTDPRPAGSTPSAAIVCVLGDLHGHITLAYRLVRRWEREHAKQIHAILQVGDFGAFPPPYRLDPATMRFAQTDQDELGFAAYVAGEPEARAVLGPEVTPWSVGADLYFIKGNHEDFEYLHGLSSRRRDGPAVPVDPFRRIYYVPNGRCVNVRGNDQVLRIAALGGIARRGSYGTNPASKDYTRAEVQQLLARAGQVDVLLTHDVPHGTVFEGAGSRDVLEAVRTIRPAYHFCGHYHEAGVELDVGVGTRSFLLNEVGFRHKRELNRGCMGILRWRGKTDHEFDLVDEPWQAEYTRRNWRELA